MASGHAHAQRAPWAARHPYLFYTIAFALLALAVFAPFWIAGRSFVWRYDGRHQHYTALVYYGRWLRDIVSGSLAAGSLQIPAFSLSLGLGADVQTTLGYYVIGDPFALGSALVPTRFMWAYYSAMIVVRLYLAGVAFIAYARGRDRFSSASLAAGACAYAFFGYALMASVRHPYFANPMIYLPLLLYGVDRVFDKRKWGVLCAAVLVSAVSNFYFLYMLAIFTFAYACARLVFALRRRDKGAWAAFATVAGVSFASVLAAGASLVPIVFAIFEGTSSIERPWTLFRSVKFYRDFLASLIAYGSLDEWTRISFGPVAVTLALSLALVKREGKASVLAAVAILGLLLLLPAAGRVLNGFMYSSNRWEWAFALALAYAAAMAFDSLADAPAGRVALFAAGLAALCVVAALLARQAMALRVAVQLALALVFLVALIVGARRAWAAPVRAMVLLASICAGIVVNAWTLYAPLPDALEALYPTYGYSSEFLPATKGANSAVAYVTTEAAWSKARYGAKGESLPRLIGAKLTHNGSAFSLLSSLHSYWSLGSARSTQLMLELGVPIPSRQLDPGVANSTAIAQVLSATTQFASGKEPSLYGYAAIKGKAGKGARGTYLNNENPLSLGYAVDAVMGRDEFESLGLVERQEALLQAAVVEDGATVAAPSVSGSALSYDTRELDIKVEPLSDSISIEEGRIVAKKAKQQVQVSFEGLPSCELYLAMEGLDCKWGSITSASVGVSFARGDGKRAQTRFDLFAPSHQNCTAQSDFIAGSGYCEKPITRVTLTFSRAGTYKLDSLRVYALPMASFNERVEKLSQDMFENIDFHMSKRTAATNLITATIDVSGHDKLLVVTLPYSNGWTAYVDGQKTPIVCANTAFMGIELASGHHDIRLEYQTPGLTLGWISTALGSAALIAWAVWNRVKKPAAPAARRGAHFA